MAAYQLSQQLWVLRDLLAKNAKEVIEQLPALNIEEVEGFDLERLQEVKPLLNSNTLNVQSCFIPILSQNTLLKTADKAAELQLQYVVQGYILPEDRRTLDDYKRMAELFNVFGSECSKRNIQFCYHNHSFEFQPMENTQPYQVLMDYSDPLHVSFELDTFWTYVAGEDPIAWMQKLGTRLKQLHLKDLRTKVPYTYNEHTFDKSQFCALGDGILDLKAIIQQAKLQDVKVIHMDQDYAIEPFSAIKASAQYLKKLLSTPC